ncbi:MAG: NifU family protein [Flavobacteriales bacterium]|jgi:Fe-S cluster biogenesis protein NfuA|nr:NifU family protein [Flavobacteriales bacterium]
MKQETRDNVLKALEEVRPHLQSDGGDISLVDITEEGVVIVELHGSCIGCSVNQVTLKVGVETTIKKYAPEITAVEEISSTKKKRRKKTTKNDA